MSNGPGSSGLRIGVSSALGISQKYNKKIKFIDTLYSLSFLINNKTDYIISILDAKADRVYFCMYKSNKKALINELIINVNDLIYLLNKYLYNIDINIVFVGDGIIRYKEIFIKRLNIKYKFISEKRNFNNALCIIKASKYVDFDNRININYIQKSNAER